MKTVTVTIKDDNKVTKSLEGRIKLLEKLLRAKKDNTKNLVGNINKQQTKQLKSLEQGLKSLSKSFTKSITSMAKPKDSNIERAFEKRIKFLETLLKELSKKDPKVIVNTQRVSNKGLEKKVASLSKSLENVKPEKTVIRETFIKQINQAPKVIPSPS